MSSTINLYAKLQEKGNGSLYRDFNLKSVRIFLPMNLKLTEYDNKKMRIDIDNETLCITFEQNKFAKSGQKRVARFHPGR